MNILLAGGTGSLMDDIINKLHKEGHRIYVLTGNRFKENVYSRKVFEKYAFPYDCDCIGEIYESVNPDVILFMGAFDTNFHWEEPRKESVRFYAGLSNLLMSYSQRGKGRFIYLSSDEVFDSGAENKLTEEAPTSPGGFHAVALAQGEDMCQGYRKNKNLDIITLRLDHLYGVPEDRKDVRSVCEKMCLEALEAKQITIHSQNEFSMLYQADAVEAIYKVSVCREHEKNTYHLSGDSVVSEAELAEIIRKEMGRETEIVDRSGHKGNGKVLSGKAFSEEFQFAARNLPEESIKKIIAYMKKYRWKFQSGFGKRNFWERFSTRTAHIIRVLLPFLENMICFIPFFMLNNRAVGSTYFANLDFYLLYVLLFAMVYGQMQATFSATMAVAGYCFRQMYTRSGFEVMLDYNTYVWIAQLFILGLAVGYMRDQLRIIKGEGEQEIDFLSGQLEDIQDINSSNVRMKNVMETQIVNQNDSVGTIYEITSKLNQYVPEEVLFYAAEMLTKLMETKDVAIYTVSGGGYARLISATSDTARMMGNSMKYTEQDDLYADLQAKRVFINKKMDERYPLMANAIYSEEEMQLIVMIWGIPWEKMTLGQANRLVVISYLIQNAVVSATRHMEELEYKRYISGTPILEKDAFDTLVQSFLKAKAKGLAECSILQIEVSDRKYEEAAKVLRGKLRQTDYMGELKDGGLYVLLSNTDSKAAQFVINKFAEVGYTARLREEVLE